MPLQQELAPAEAGGAPGIDGQDFADIEAFGEGLEERRVRLHEELRTDQYIPQPVRQQRIPKVGKPGEWRVLGIPTIYDRVCQQALLNPKFLLRLDASH